VVIGDALQPVSLEAVARDVDVVFSCVGQTVSADMSIRRPGYLDVDLPANLNLLAAAKQAKVDRFVYVSVLHAGRYAGIAYMGAHARVAEAVMRSSLGYGIIEPTGFYSAYRAFLDMARNNQAVLFGDGRSKTNPIHDADLAGLCADVICEKEPVTVQAGGPLVHTRREILELAFAALAKPVRIRSMPLAVPKLLAASSHWFAPRISELMSFVHALSANDFVAPPLGERSIGDYFRSLVTESQPAAAGSHR
jgi:uncharacterized protein YbjT (DUF2867 family)